MDFRQNPLPTAWRSYSCEGCGHGPATFPRQHTGHAMSLYTDHFDNTLPTTLPPPAFSPDVILARLRGDHDLLREIIEMFLDDFGAMLREVRQAAEANDANRLSRAAHKLRGSVGNFSLSAAHKTCAMLEAMGSENQLDQAAAACTTLEVEVDRLATELRDFLSRERNSKL